MINIALIGAGQLGSRHLQALASLKHQAAIQVIDPSIDSLNTAEARFKEVSSGFNGKISFNSNISTLEKEIDVAIIATNSKMRRTVIEHLTSNSTVKNLILEKFLFVKEEDYKIVEKIITEKKIKTWVNCARRVWQFYQNLQEELSGNIHFAAVGNAWGLGCNGIHLLDLFAFLTKSNNILLSNDLIDKKIVSSKRPGYIEFTGTITGQTNEHSFHITSFPNHTSPLHITINTPTARYSIEEGVNPRARVSRYNNDWKWEEKSFIIPPQSQLTNKVIDEILNSGDCGLTSYKESSQLHLLFLNNLLSFLRRINNDNSIDECLVT